MSAAAVLSDQQCDDIVEDSIQKQARIVLTHRVDDGWRTYKTHFVSGTTTSRHITVAALVRHDGAQGPLPASGETVGVTFRVGHKKCMFSTQVADPAQASEQDDVQLQWPRELHQLQRRAFERAAPPRGHVIPVRFWPVVSSTDGEQQRHVHYGELEDLSAGGMRLNVPADQSFDVDGSFQCMFTPRRGEEPIIVEASCRHREAPAGVRTSLGFQFVGLETTADGREVLNRLARIVAAYQRAQRRGD